jgi:hypothetical protein
MFKVKKDNKTGPQVILPKPWAKLHEVTHDIIQCLWTQLGGRSSQIAFFFHGLSPQVSLQEHKLWEKRVK